LRFCLLNMLIYIHKNLYSTVIVDTVICNPLRKIAQFWLNQKQKSIYKFPQFTSTPTRYNEHQQHRYTKQITVKFISTLVHWDTHVRKSSYHAKNRERQTHSRSNKRVVFVHSYDFRSLINGLIESPSTSYQYARKKFVCPEVSTGELDLSKAAECICYFLYVGEEGT
jgi:hypothetical protein